MLLHPSPYLFAAFLLGAYNVHNTVASVADKPSQSFLSSNNTDLLLPGSFIVAGLIPATEFAHYLQDNPEVVVNQLLLSDSSIWDIDNNYGFLDRSKYYARARTSGDSGFVQYSDYYNDMDIPDEEADVVAHNTKLSRKQKRLLRDHPAVLDRILNHTHTSLETFSYLLYIENYPRYDYIGYSRMDPAVARSEGDLRLFNCDFPRLRDLTVKASGVWQPLARNTGSTNVANRKLPEEMMDQSRSLWEFPQLDSVTHLHIIGDQDTNLIEKRPLSSYSEQFKNLNQIRLTDQHLLPGEFYPQYHKISVLWEALKTILRGVSLDEEWYYPHYVKPPGLWNEVKGRLQGVSYETEWRPFPENLTVIVQPGFSVLLGNDNKYCGTPDVDYNDLLRKLDSMKNKNVHLSWPIQSDWLKYKWRGVFPLQRAISNFRERISGGDGEWKVGEELNNESPREWWWNRGREEDNVIHDEL
ncbi:hypothetical protein J3R30DRAFT_3531790 [Lentinula aciculospora]|uniref:Uncharacterized protein n=1 Tax=Lentinula aciculospora TaxID=153920 RepID=A0A9W9DIC9_9AGAR|nr:hypothetical protein J3R30DRAFT_3531790 [Lentinula aciculospora]